jgi:hypothetical protein
MLTMTTNSNNISMDMWFLSQGEFHKFYLTSLFEVFTSMLYVLSSGPMRGGISRYIVSWSVEPRRDPWISEWSHSLSHRRFILIFSFLGVFSTQIINFESSLSLFQGPQSSLVPPCKISLGGLFEFPICVDSLLSITFGNCVKLMF